MMGNCGCDRRGFFGHAFGCGAWVAIALTAGTATARQSQARTLTDPVVTSAFARIEKLADGVWAVISTPFAPDGGRGDRTTLSNGGIIAGRDGVLVVEGFNTPAGGAWLSDQALALTGRRPTHVVATHYHLDHVGGLSGFRRGADGPELLMTAQTGALSAQRNGLPRPVEGSPFAKAAPVLLPTLIVPEGEAVLDLGGRTVRLVARTGHTDSDVTVELDDPRVIFGGDLLWNGIFPNYVDADPVKLSAAVRAVLADPATLVVPGHGSLSNAADLSPYLGVLDAVEAAARRAHAAGMTVEKAASAFTLPPGLGAWTLFSAGFYTNAFKAWYRVLG
ncbi:MBL fold metallo-hydrolase [Niveispirillum lacus]|nr:MBL fold metallo-hydrolase [Niveispirillum lacus]